MKTAQATYGKSFAFIFLFLLSQRSFTQVRALYDQLDMSEVTSNYFYPQTLKDLVIPNPTTFDDELTPKKAASLFMAFDKACIDSELYIGNFGEFRKAMRNSAKADVAIPISILDITYHDFISNPQSREFSAA